MFVVFSGPASILSLSGGSACNSFSEAMSPSPFSQLIGFHLVSRSGKWPRPGQLAHGILFGHSDWFRSGHPSAYKNQFEMDKRCEMAHSESQTCTGASRNRGSKKKRKKERKETEALFSVAFKSESTQTQNFWQPFYSTVENEALGEESRPRRRRKRILVGAHKVLNPCGSSHS